MTRTQALRMAKANLQRKSYRAAAEARRLRFEPPWWFVAIFTVIACYYLWPFR